MSYDELFFSSKPSPDRHIDRFSILSQLCGIAHSSPESPRVLELGCSTGINLISLALSAPHGRYLGIDNSKKQIEEASSCACELGLKQVQFECIDLVNFSSKHGTFDYIICHGVFSWVTLETQHAILKLAQQCLSERGVFFLSFNAQPGWNLRGAIGAWLRSCPQPHDTSEAVAVAKERLEALKHIQIDDYSPSGIVTRDAINHLLEQSAALFMHEALNPLSSSISLVDLQSMASEYGLTYAADSAINHVLFQSGHELGPSFSISPSLQAIQSDIVLQEYMWDLLHPRALRKTILCRAGASKKRPDRFLRPEWYVAAPIQTPQASVSLHDHTAALFESGRGISLEITDPLLKAALVVLSQNWPLPITVTRLCVCIDELLSKHGPGKAVATEAHSEKVSEALFPLFVQGSIEVTESPPLFSITPSHKPLAHPLARRQSKTHSWVPNYRHEFTTLSSIEGSILRLLDGTRTHAELNVEMRRLYETQEILLTATAEEVQQFGGEHNLLSQLLDETLLSFGKAALISADY